MNQIDPSDGQSLFCEQLRSVVALSSLQILEDHEHLLSKQNDNRRIFAPIFVAFVLGNSKKPGFIV